MGFFKKAGRAIKKAYKQAETNMNHSVGKATYNSEVAKEFVDAFQGMGNSMATMVGGKTDTFGDAGRYQRSIEKNQDTLKDIGKGMGYLAAGMATGGAAAAAMGATGAAAGGYVALGGLTGAAVGGTKVGGEAAARSAEHAAARERDKLRAGAVDGAQSAMGDAVGASVGEQVAVTDPVEEMNRRRRSRDSKRVFGSASVGSSDKLGSTGSLGAGY